MARTAFVVGRFTHLLPDMADSLYEAAQRPEFCAHQRVCLPVVRVMQPIHSIPPRLWWPTEIANMPVNSVSKHLAMFIAACDAGRPLALLLPQAPFGREAVPMLETCTRTVAAFAAKNGEPFFMAILWQLRDLVRSTFHLGDGELPDADLPGPDSGALRSFLLSGLWTACRMANGWIETIETAE